MKLRDPRGSTLVEFSLLTPIVLTLTLILLCTLYLLTGRAWLEYQSEQVLFCLAEGHRRSTCQSSYAKAVAAVLPFGRTTQFKITSTKRRWSIETKWELRPPLPQTRPVVFHIQKIITDRRIQQYADRFSSR